MFENFRVYLRALEPDDYKTSIKWRNDDQIWNMVGGPKYYVSEAYEKKWVEDAIFNRTNMSLAICLKETDEYIGNTYLNNINYINRTASTATMIGEKKYWSSGLATEAKILVLYFAFYERGLNRIATYILEENVGSQKLCEKCGYIKEGILRESIYKNGAYKNQIVMSVLKKDFDEVLKSYK